VILEDSIGEDLTSFFVTEEGFLKEEKRHVQVYLGRLIDTNRTREAQLVQQRKLLSVRQDDIRDSTEI
jgi:hypothetical protein